MVHSSVASPLKVVVMLKSDAERILRRTMEETKMQLTEQQIQCLSQAMLKIAQQVVEEALSLYNPKTGR